MKIFEYIINELDVDEEILSQYFQSLEEREGPSIQGLFDYIYRNYYVSDLIKDYEVKNVGDINELLEYYKKYLNND